ncbi:MAG: phage baseplate protein [Zetaproteobacteria bacterium CG1_02_53_45]|nr:MAG: phage baseplate protein [Zetaproteobacteria bacterium CG1_02_53_45]
MAMRLTDPAYLAFPLRVNGNGGELAKRSRHVRDQIEQVLFTMPGERVFRPEFGAGMRALLFEPNASALWTVAKKRLLASLADALKGEVDPRSLEVDVSGEGERVEIVISYTLAVVGYQERLSFTVGHDGC